MAPRQSLCESIHVAALIACDWPSLMRESAFTTQASERYWIASRTRLERWSACAARWEAAWRFAELAARQERHLRALLHEVFATEPLTRIWTAAATVMDRMGGHREIEPYASSIFLAHQDARHRCMRLVVKAHALNAERGRSFDRVRRRAERWCDMLLSRMTQTADVSRWAFDQDRVADFAGSTVLGGNQELADEMLLTALTNSRLARDAAPCLHPELNERIAGSLLAAFGPDSIDATGPFRALWQTRLHYRSHDLDSMISQILAQESL